MRKMPLTARLRSSFERRGLLETVRRCAVRGYRLMRAPRMKPHPFDIAHGVQTQALIPNDRPSTGHAHDLYGVFYYPTPPSVFQTSIEAWRSTLHATEPPLEQYTFFDLGAGMGRVVMLASLYPFQRVIGIELNPRLVERGRANLGTWQGLARACCEVEIAAGDATEFPWPARPIVLYMFYPFEEPVVLELLRSLEQALRAGAGPIDIIYVHPMAALVVENYPGVHLKMSTICNLSAEDAALDSFHDSFYGGAYYECRIYRFTAVEAKQSGRGQRQS